MAFGDIPERQNGIDQLIDASWFNTIRQELLNAFGTGGYIFVQDLQTLDDNDEITTEEEAFKPFIPVVGNGAPITVNSIPFGSSHGFGAGKEIVIMGTDDTNTVKLVSNNADEGMILNGASVTLKAYNKITLMYYAATKRFIELERNF